MAFEGENETDSECCTGSQQGYSQQCYAHGVSVGQELHQLWDTGISLQVGPELRSTCHTLYGILHTEKEKTLK